MNIQSRSIVTITLFIAVVLAGVFALNPSWKKFNEARTLESQAKLKQANLTSEESMMEQFIKEFKENEKHVATANTALPVKGASVESILANLDEMARSSGLALSDVILINNSDPDKKPAANSVQNQEISFVAAGTFPAFKNFLLLLESNLRIIDIRDISFEVNEDGVAEYRMSFVTYYQN
jgi:Tfp pilus assembly protein PilO